MTKEGKKATGDKSSTNMDGFAVVRDGTVDQLRKAQYWRGHPPILQENMVLFYHVFKMMIQTNIIHIIGNDCVWRVHSTLSRKRDRVSFRKWPRNARKRKFCCLLIFNFDWQSESENSLFNQYLHFIIKKCCFSFSSLSQGLLS